MSVTARTITATKTGAYTAKPNEVVPCDATAGAFSVALPLPINGVGQAPITIGPKLDATGNAVTITTPAGTIRGAASLVSRNDVLTFVSNGVDWFALNSIGSGSSTGVPSAPTAVVGTSGNGQVSVAFTPGASNPAATGYTATSTPGGLTATGASSPIVVTGLTNGTAYTFTVHATNSIGNSAESSPSAAVTPATVPGAPTAVVGTPGNTTASIAFSAPGSNGGAAITSYTATLSPGGATFSGASSPISATGLTNGTAYTATVHATNAVGDGAESSASSAFTPFGTTFALLMESATDRLLLEDGSLVLLDP